MIDVCSWSCTWLPKKSLSPSIQSPNLLLYACLPLSSITCLTSRGQVKAVVFATYWQSIVVSAISDMAGEQAAQWNVSTWLQGTATACIDSRSMMHRASFFVLKCSSSLFFMLGRSNGTVSWSRSFSRPFWPLLRCIPLEFIESRPQGSVLRSAKEVSACCTCLAMRFA